MGACGLRFERRGEFAGAVLEGWYGLLGRKSEPVMTRFLARQLATSHWFNIDRARKDLGYAPRVSIAHGLEALASYLRESGQA